MHVLLVFYASKRPSGQWTILTKATSLNPFFFIGIVLRPFQIPPSDHSLALRRLPSALFVDAYPFYQPSTAITRKNTTNTIGIAHKAMVLGRMECHVKATREWCRCRNYRQLIPWQESQTRRMQTYETIHSHVEMVLRTCHTPDLFPTFKKLI